MIICTSIIYEEKQKNQQVCVIIEEMRVITNPFITENLEVNANKE